MMESRRTLKEKIRHAFAVNSPDDRLTEEERSFLDRLADGIVKRKMGAPAVLFLESSRPLNNIGAHLMLFFEPIVGFVFKDTTSFATAEKIFEKRESVPVLIEKIESCGRSPGFR